MNKQEGYVKPFTIIKHAGIPVEAITLDNKKVYRQERLFIPELMRFVVTADYDNHFIYENPVKHIGSAFLCTCGSAAIIAGYNAYKEDASPTTGLGIQPGELFVCYHHAHTGLHADGST